MGVESSPGVESDLAVVAEEIRVIEVSDPDALDAHREAWNGLAVNSPPYFPTCCHAYLRAFFECSLEEDQRWMVYFAYCEDRLVGVLPLIESRKRRLGLGATTLGTPSNEDTFGVAPLLSKGRERRVLDALLESAWAANPLARHVEVRDVSTRLGLEGYSGGQAMLVLSSRTGRFISTRGVQEDYQASLSKNFKKNQRKAFNKLNKLDGVSYEFIEGTPDNTALLDEFMRIEGLSWKGREGTAVQCSEAMTAFYRKLVEHLSALGWIEWQVLRAEGKTIAINLTVPFGRSVFILKLGYDDAYRNCSPGGMLYQKQVDKCFSDDGIDEVDIITDAKWYDDWKMEKREYRLMRYYNPARLRSLCFARTLDRLKRSLRRNEALSGLIDRLRGH